MSVIIYEDEKINGIFSTLQTNTEILNIIQQDYWYNKTPEFIRPTPDRWLGRLLWYMSVANKVAYTLQYQENVPIISPDIEEAEEYDMKEACSSFGGLWYNCHTNDGNLFLGKKWSDLVEKIDDYCGKKYKYYAKGGNIKFKEGGYNDDTPKIYVADLGAYNSGKLIGKWVDLTDFDSGEEVVDYIHDLMEEYSEKYHNGLETEHAIHDYENFDSLLYSEWMGKKDYDKIIKSYEVFKDRTIPTKVLTQLSAEYDIEPDDLEEYVDDHYVGEFNTDTDLAYHIVDEWYGGVENLDKRTLGDFFNFERYGEAISYDYNEIDDHYFSNRAKGGLLAKGGEKNKK